MFRTKKRPLLYLPIIDSPTFHYTAPKPDEPRLILQYVTPAERDRIIAAHTQKKFYPRPLDTNAMLQIAAKCWDLPIVQQRAAEVANSIEMDMQIIGNMWHAITREISYLPQPEFIERNERNDTDTLMEICERAIVGWEQVRDDESGELIPFSFFQLKAFLQEGGEFTIWCMQHVPMALKQFDDLIKEQKAQTEKNSFGLSEPSAETAA